MSRGKKLGLLLMILLLLTVGTLLTENRTAEVTEAETEEDTVLFDAAAETLSSLSWTWEGETITLLKDGENWSCGADPDFPLSSAKTEALVKALYGLRAEKTIDKPGNLSEYGLDAPVMSITVSADTETTFEIGSGSSLDGYLYVSKGDGRVCLVDESLKESFSCGLYDLVRKESLPDMSDMTCLSVDSEVGNYEIAHIEDSGIAYTDQYEWFLKNGDGWLTLDNTQAEEFVDQIRFLAWQECVDYRADETALISYGLDEPAVTAEILYTESRQLETDILADDGKPICDTVAEEKSFVLEIGDYVDSFCYARLAGSPMVYKIAASVCDSLLYMSYDELRPGDVILLDRDELTEAEVTVDGESHTFTKSRETVSDENGENSSRTVWLLDGEEKAFPEVLNTLSGMVSASFADGEVPKRDAELSFRFRRDNEQYPETELIFYTYDNSRCLVTLDGESTVYVSRSSVTELADQIRQLTSAASETDE